MAAMHALIESDHPILGSGKKLEESLLNSSIHFPYFLQILSKNIEATKPEATEATEAAVAAPGASGEALRAAWARPL